MFLSRLWILISLAILAASDKYKKLGGDAVLSSSAVSGRISSITWKHGADIAVEWYGRETVSYRDFKGRCKLDFNTGALTISNLTVKDSGIYTAEINNKVMSPTEITVISAVPKPTVSTQCSSEGCTFTCEASITGAEPVTYSWMVDGKNITGSSKSLQKEKDDPEMVGKPISCQLKNPVSSEHSDDVIPFPNSDYVGPIIGVVVAFVIAVAVGLFIWCRCRRGSQNSNTDAGHCFACFTKRSSEPSGRSQDYTPVQTEEGAEVAYMKAGEIHNQEQNSESTQSKHEPEPSGRSQDYTPVQTEDTSEEGVFVIHSEPSRRSQDKADEEKAQISTSNGPVAYMKAGEIHNQEQNSESTQSKHEPEPSGRSQDYTPVQTEEGAEVAYMKAGEIHNQEQNSESTQSKHEPEEKAQISTSNGPVAYMKAGEIHNQEQNSESTQSKHEPEEKAQISTSNGPVAYMKAGEIHNQEQNSESTQSKHEPEPSGRSQDYTPVQTEETSGRSQDYTPVQTEEGAEDTSEEGTLEL